MLQNISQIKFKLRQYLNERLNYKHCEINQNVEIRILPSMLNDFS